MVNQDDENLKMLEGLIKKQTVTGSEIERCIRNFKKANKEQKASVGSLQRRLTALESEWENYKATHKEIIEEYNEQILKELTYFKDDVFSEVEDKVFETLGAITDLITNLNHKVNNSSQIDSPLVFRGVPDSRLPRINLPKFTGDYKAWSSFRDLFTSLIHKNDSLNQVQKLHYLKGSVGGEAEQLIKHLQVTEANYQPAWNLLTKRYENKRALLNASLKTLFSLPNHSSESANSLRMLMDTTRECLESIKGLGVDISNWDSLIVYHLTQKLNVETLCQWELTLNKRPDPNEIPDLEEFLTFIDTRFRTFEAISLSKTKQYVKDKVSFTIQGKKSAEPRSTSTSLLKTESCLLCKQPHPLRDCPKFSELNLDDRRATVQRLSCCYNCLLPGHSVVKCRSKYRCRACNGRHHTLLHQYTASQDPNRDSITNSNSVDSNIQERFSHTSSNHPSDVRVLLATALVLAKNVKGHSILLRALIDQGSETSFISQAASKLLHLQESDANVQIRGIGGSHIVSADKFVQFTICSHYNPHAQFSVEAFVLPKLTGLLPPTYVQCHSLTHLVLADPSYFKPGRIDILLGADIYAQIVEEGVRKGPAGTPFAQCTSLGWILSGRINCQERYSLINRAVANFHCKAELDILLRRFWEVEETSTHTDLSTEEIECENTKDMVPDLGGSREIAVRQLLQGERRLERNAELKTQCTDFMKDYETQGHMELVTRDIQGIKPNYLPHHFVTKASSTTIKLRVVFDASRKTTNNKSLNDNLMVGPVVQEDLVSILIRWRMHKIAFTADVKQMYRQILVDRNDTDFQRILWRYNKDEPIREYRLLTVTYGTSCAPHLATRTLQQLAQDEMEKYPKASNTLLHDFYVDDVLSGGDSLDEVIQLQVDLKALLKGGGFELRKWASNKQEILESVSETERELEVPFDITGRTSIKTLGTFWDLVKDIFLYKVNNIEYTPPTTKRTLLSTVAKIFDPLGWLAPVIITAKIMFQTLWLHGLDWDSKLPLQLEEQWKGYCCRLKEIERIEIPRWINYKRDVKVLELHVFSDASIHAYAASVYCRVISNNDTIHVMLLTAKTKVAPIKSVTLPRLELCGALLGTRLVASVAKALGVIHSNIYSWTDSRIVLGWVRSHPRHLKQYVSNRVTEIQNTLNGNTWNYVPSKENPADYSSRGLTPSQLQQCELWWNGPQWLYEEKSKWPIIQDETDLNLLELETKQLKTCNITTLIGDESCLLKRYSSYSRLIRICAYCKRFCNNLRSEIVTRKTGHLKVKELRDTEKCLIKISQYENFREEINDLQKSKPLKSSSKILKLNSFLDDEGLLRVGGG